MIPIYVDDFNFWLFLLEGVFYGVVLMVAFHFLYKLLG